jgi:RNA polymerase sigma factor (sigma-70 family)
VRRDDADDQWLRFGAGDGTAFAQLYRDHHHDVVRYCRSLLNDDEDARDAAQCTWAAIWSSSSAAQRRAPLRPWLFRVAHNESISILRRRRVHDVLAEVELPALDDVAADVELRERLTTLRADLLSLPERQRSALLLREIGGLAHAEIADVLGISAPAAKQTIYEARRALVEAEGGRSLACSQVERAISDGDGRVRRSRRLRAHLRGCASCRAFADGLGRQRGDLNVLFPPAAGLAALAPAVAGSAAGAGGAAGGGLLATGGSVAAKVAVTTVVAAAGVGGAHVVRHAHAEASRAPATAASHRSAPAVRPARRSVVAVRLARPPAEARHVKKQPAAARAVRPGHAKKKTAAPRIPPGQAKRIAAPRIPRGQAKRAAAPRIPPGQAKKIAAPRIPPGQAKKIAAPKVPPGQAKKLAAPASAPGQARK